MIELRLINDEESSLGPTQITHTNFSLWVCFGLSLYVSL